MITYLREGRTIRGSGDVLHRYTGGNLKVKPHRKDWGIIVVTAAEVEAGKEKPPMMKRDRNDGTNGNDGTKPKRERKPKPLPVLRWKELVDRVRLYEADHVPDGWPGVKMRFLTELADELEAAQTLFQQKPQL